MKVSDLILENDFLKTLSQKILICDGAMGTLLHEYGIPFDRCFDELNLSSPKTVSKIHRDYITAGADIIETNTFGANRSRLAKFGFENKVREINRLGARIAREAQEVSGEFVWIAGSIGPLGKPLKPIGPVRPEEAQSYFAEQVDALLEGGVDLFIIETFSDLSELGIAIAAVRKACDKPIIAETSFTEENKTFLAFTPEEVVRTMSDFNVDVIGANCSVGPQQLLGIIEIMSHWTDKPLAAMPNAGLPKYIDGRFVYLSSPDYFAEHAQSYIKLGARIVGGCCGTTPLHIRAIKELIDRPEEPKTEKAERPRIEVKDDLFAEDDDISSIESEPSLLSFIGNKQFLISTEIDPPKGGNPAKILKGAMLLKEAGTDIMNVADSPMARVRMSAVTAAYLIQNTTGVEVVLHLTCRDRNLMGLQSDLLGCHALGIRNILAITGDPPSIGDYPSATAVYDVDSIGLTSIIKKLNSGFDYAGNSIGKPTRFSIGIGINPNDNDSNREYDRLMRKIEAGAQYAFTQPLYELDPLLSFLDRIKIPDFPVFLGILPLQNFKHASFLHYEIPGINIPAPVLKRIQNARDQGIEEGAHIASELILQAANLVAGVYFMPSFGRYAQIAGIIKEIKPKLIDIRKKGKN